MSQPPQPPYSGEPYPGQPSSGQPYPGQPYQGQQYPQQPYQPPQPPYQQQPYQGQPNPDVPTSVPPGYQPTTAFPAPDYGQQPQYGQQPPPYGQTDYAQQGFGQPGFPPPAPPKKSKVLPIVLTSIAIVLVLCVGGVIALVMIGNNAKKDNQTGQAADPTPQGTGPTTDTVDPTTKPPASTVKITEPKTLGGRPKLTDAQFADVAKQLQTSLKAVPGATNSVGALYGTVAKQDIVILAAAEAPIDDPAGELTQTFYGAGIGGLKVENITSVSTGTLGGSAKCGSASTNGVDMAICSWADDGSLGMMIWYFKSVGKAKSEFPKLRAEVEKKS